MRSIVISIVSAAALLGACGDSPPLPAQTAEARVQAREDWPITGDIVRDASPPHPFHASRTLRYPELTAGLAEPAWDSPDAPSGTLSVWFHLGTTEAAPGTSVKAVTWDDDPAHHCLHEHVSAPFVEVRYVERVRGSRVFPSQGGSTTTAGQLLIDAPSSGAGGASGQLEITLTDAAGHARRIKAKIRFDAPKDLWKDEYGECPKS